MSTLPNLCKVKGVKVMRVGLILDDITLMIMSKEGRKSKGRSE